MQFEGYKADDYAELAWQQLTGDAQYMPMAGDKVAELKHVKQVGLLSGPFLLVSLFSSPCWRPKVHSTKICLGCWVPSRPWLTRVAQHMPLAGTSWPSCAT